MAGLVAYASSDDEDGTAPQISHSTVSDIPSKPEPANQETELAPPDTYQASLHSQSPPPPPPQQQQPPSQPQPQSQSTIRSIPLGPSLPPPDANTSLLLEPLPEPSPSRSSSPSDANAADPTNAPSSPYSSTRAIMHDLTLPSFPNLTIPSSPPGSPPPATNKKFQQFLHLKRKGTHFNTRLESSHALRNPSLTDKLLSFVDLTGPAQYETTLPPELYDPTYFPSYAHTDNLRKAREALVKEREADRVSARGVDFVHASSMSTTPLGGGGGATAAGGLVSRAEKRKSGWK
ncbi:hypothetical protein E4U43_001847 [Claviceps pusilla]|uniref:HCNGP-like protein n=1 Tax=Claviceps pusilla TaxID=123648 RepID=A0A9P7N763_9HYPO|nr:hypothetical protein E4U43_001847 [Claviceps pusilla]